MMSFGAGSMQAEARCQGDTQRRWPLPPPTPEGVNLSALAASPLGLLRGNPQAAAPVWVVLVPRHWASSERHGRTLGPSASSPEYRARPFSTTSASRLQAAPPGSRAARAHTPR